MSELADIRFHVPKMDCATEKVITRRLSKVKGIERLDFDLIERIVIVDHGANEQVPAAVEATLDDIDMAPARLDGTHPAVASGPIPPSRRQTSR